jgi:hypothetical protein
VLEESSVSKRSTVLAQLSVCECSVLSQLTLLELLATLEQSSMRARSVLEESLVSLLPMFELGDDFLPVPQVEASLAKLVA